MVPRAQIPIAAENPLFCTRCGIETFFLINYIDNLYFLDVHDSD